MLYHDVNRFARFQLFLYVADVYMIHQNMVLCTTRFVLDFICGVQYCPLVFWGFKINKNNNLVSNKALPDDPVAGVEFRASA
jgi:hypothetical protein